MAVKTPILLRRIGLYRDGHRQRLAACSDAEAGRSGSARGYRSGGGDLGHSRVVRFKMDILCERAGDAFRLIGGQERVVFAGTLELECAGPHRQRAWGRRQTGGRSGKRE